MNFNNLTLENLKRDAEHFIFTYDDSYLISYPEFLKYFESISFIKHHHLIISSHFVYGWMPTIIHIDLKEVDRVLSLLNDVKSGHQLNVDEFRPLKNCVNNSLVGLSKLLHFINPSDYAIWDSNIYRYVSRAKSLYGIDKIENYLEYLDRIREIAQHKDYQQLHELVQRYLKYSITPMRAIEIIMFENGRMRNQLKIK